MTGEREAGVAATVAAAAERGRPLTPRDLLAFEAAAVRKAFESGAIERGEMTFAGQTLAVVLPGIEPPEVRLDAAADPALRYDPQAPGTLFDEAQLAWLDAAYTSGVSFTAMQQHLQVSGTAILREAWRRKLDRPGALYARAKAPRTKAPRAPRRPVPGTPEWAQAVPAWRVHRLRRLLAETRARGRNPYDDGEDLEHRALQRVFARARAEMLPSTGALRLENHGTRWTAEDVERLKTLHRKGRSLAEIATTLRRTVFSVTAKIHKLGLERRQQCWTAEEDAILARVIEARGTGAEAAEVLPGRSAFACKQRAVLLLGPRGFAPWRPDEVADLRRAVAAGENLKTWARDHGRGLCGVRYKCRSLGLSHPKAGKAFTSREVTFLEANYARLGYRACAARLGRSASSVATFASKTGLAGGKVGGGRGQGLPVKRYEIAYIRARAAQGWTFKEVAARMNRGPHSVYKIAARNGISFAPKRRRKTKPNPPTTKG